MAKKKNQKKKIPKKENYLWSFHTHAHRNFNSQGTCLKTLSLKNFKTVKSNPLGNRKALNTLGGVVLQRVAEFGSSSLMSLNSNPHNFFNINHNVNLEKNHTNYEC